MLLRNILISLVMASVVFVGCSKAEKKPDAGKSTKKTAAPSETIASAPRAFRAAAYSDDAQWLKGVNRIDKKQFFMVIGKNDPPPVNRGYKLKFTASGEATIQKVNRVEKPDKSFIFITVEKDLDPTGDGNPNPIYIKSFQIRPSSYSRENDWENGISLKSTGAFVFVLPKSDACPLKIGDRLKFAASGEAIVKKIARSDGQGPGGKYSNFHVTVDKPLDPASDGGPNLIEVIIEK
ncbi:MAG: hypothetical protein NT166_04845 [Candidatus Aminicenantes bacterium]|nr:hypothetical protein [Candidatus Aminicenantes bacterium]